MVWSVISLWTPLAAAGSGATEPMVPNNPSSLTLAVLGLVMFAILGLGRRAIAHRDAARHRQRAEQILSNAEQRRAA